MNNSANSILAGVPEATLRQWLLAAQSAYNDLMTGGKPVTVSYAQGDGAKSVSYAKADMPALAAYIAQLQLQLGIGRGRRPLRPYF